MISVQSVSKSFGPVRALRDVSFEVERGEIVGLLGPNGAGKTTMLRLITGFFPPSEGKISIASEALTCANVKVRRKIGYLAEHNPLYRDMTTKDFLKFVAQLKGIPASDHKRTIAHVTEQCGLGSVFNRLIGKLSKGFQQRVGLAQALLGDPELLILDEPTSGLDPKQIIEIRNLIRELGRERTILLSTHILPEVKMTCQLMLILNEGRLVASGTAEDLESKLRASQEFRVTIRGDWQGGDAFLKQVPGILDTRRERDSGVEREYLIIAEHGKDVRSQLARQILSADFELIALQPTQWNLEDIFLKIVTRETGEAVLC